MLCSGKVDRQAGQQAAYVLQVWCVREHAGRVAFLRKNRIGRSHAPGGEQLVDGALGHRVEVAAQQQRQVAREHQILELLSQRVDIDTMR